MTPPDVLLRAMFDRAVEVADPMRCLAAHLPPRPAARVVVVGAGKASARMAEAVEAEWGPCDGLVITRYGYARPCQQIEIVEAAHPVPDAAGVQATQRMLTLLGTLGPDDFVLALISGGGSALLTAPAGDITLADKQKLTEALLASGAPIGDINSIRKQLSAVKGGGLAAAAYPAQVLSLIISDVPGDAPGDIASGPTVGHVGTPSQALAILDRWGVTPPPSVNDWLASHGGAVRPDDQRLSKTENVVVAAPSQSLAAAAEVATDYDVHIIGDAIEGEARAVARDHAQRAVDLQQSLTRPAVVLSGGELTVTRTGSGVGGPNAEYALAMALALNGAPGIHAIACDTDGVDGAAEVAGALIAPSTLDGHYEEASRALNTNDAHSFFASLGAQVITGPTLTNVNDFRATLIMPLGPEAEAHVPI